MKVRLVLVVILFALSGIVLAQQYQIRADAKLNLRNWYSTNSRIVESVPAGTVLQVVGRFNRWLKIDRNGSEVWLADWVRFTRIGGGSAPAESAPDAPAAQPKADVDNYCFTIRTCDSQDDWVRGYNDYQRDAAAGKVASTNEGNSIVSPETGGGEVTFYEFLGVGSYDPGAVFLTAGTWEIRFIGAGWASVHASEPAGQDCLASWLSRIWVLWKWSNILGASNEEAGTIALKRDCDIRIDVDSSSRHVWSIKLTKL